jgi:DNA-binding MarR family transcriptional regulator
VNKTINKAKNNSPGNTDFELWVLLDQTRFAIFRAREMELAHFGLTLTQAVVLHTLQNRGGTATIIEIAKFTMKQHHSISTLINRMVRQGLVKKSKGPDNKIQVAITPKGQETYAKATQSSIEMIFSALSREEKQKFGVYLKQVRSKARNLLGMDYKPPFLPD